jgi:putative ABC transport system ATP-binding protein
MQRAAIARALATNPLLILADEPTGNLDSENGKSILKLFTELYQQGVTIIIVTHDLSVAAHCQRLIRMQDGCIIQENLECI